VAPGGGVNVKAVGGNAPAAGAPHSQFTEYLAQVIHRVIGEAVYKDTGDAEEGRSR
jgi:hypothetical protein